MGIYEGCSGDEMPFKRDSRVGTTTSDGNVVWTDVGKAYWGRVWGWLLLLCVLQAVVFPLLAGVLAVALLVVMLSSPDIFFSFVNVIAVAGLGSLAVENAVSGILLWKRVPFGVFLTRVALFSNIVFSTIMLLAARDKVVWADFLMGFVLYGLVWGVYLNVSKRVAAVYKTN